MGQTQVTGNYFADAYVKEHFSAVQTLWNEADLVTLLQRLKDMTLNFSLDKMKFATLLQLSSTHEALVLKWFQDFSHDRASQVVDGLEFLSASIMVSSKVPLFKKICLLFNLFDLDKTDCIRKDEFTIFLKASTTGLHRMVSGCPPPSSVMELGSVSTELFNSLTSQVLLQYDLLRWMTEDALSLRYLCVLSRLGCTTFAWGANHRRQLGLNMEPKLQRVPTPVLSLEGIRVVKVASHESHSLFLTDEGFLWSSGSGFCGILGHGNLLDSPQPRVIDALAHTRVVDIAVGVRHSVAVSEKGQVFTWGCADMGQLGHGSSDDKEVHESAFDPKTGGEFSYVIRPTVVMGLFGKKVLAKKVSCCNFSTLILTDQGHIYSWGNNTDGQCGQGQRCPDHKLIYVDIHMHRTAMQAILEPRRLEANALFRTMCSGGYHTLAIDKDNRLWSWGQGLWGKLGHGDQKTCYEPTLVEALKDHICQDVAAGESHSICLCSLYRLTVTGASTTVPVAPFSLLGLPTGNPSKKKEIRKTTTPLNTTLQLNAFASAELLQVGLPFRLDPKMPIIDHSQYPVSAIRESIVLMSRGLWEGEWLKIETADFDFAVKMSSSGFALPLSTGLNGKIMMPTEDGTWEESDCLDRICVFELSSRTNATTEAELAEAVLQLALSCQQGRGLACLCILPKKVDLYDIVASEYAPESVVKTLKTFPFGVMSYEHGHALKKHIKRLVNMRIEEAPDRAPDDTKDWKEMHEEFTGRRYFENIRTGARRWAPPMIDANTQGALWVIKEDNFFGFLQAVLGLGPKGVIVCQASWKPDVELVNLPEDVFSPEMLDIPVVLVTYEAGEELRSVVNQGCEPWVTMEMQRSGGVYAFGNGTHGQLGLSGIENQNFLTVTQNALTNQENTFANRPYYVAHLHEHLVTNIACGMAHTVAVTHHGEVLSWGAADGLGVLLDKPESEVPVFVEQLEGLVKAHKVFAGHYHSFVVADMPFKSVVALDA